MIEMRLSREAALDRVETLGVVGVERDDELRDLRRSVGRLEDVFCLGAMVERVDCGTTDRVERLDRGATERAERLDCGVTDRVERLWRDAVERVERLDCELIDGVDRELRLREVELRTRWVEDDPDDRLCRLEAGDGLGLLRCVLR